MDQLGIVQDLPAVLARVAAVTDVSGLDGIDAVAIENDPEARRFLPHHSGVDILVRRVDVDKTPPLPIDPDAARIREADASLGIAAAARIGQAVGIDVTFVEVGEHRTRTARKFETRTARKLARRAQESLRPRFVHRPVLQDFVQITFETTRGEHDGGTVERPCRAAAQITKPDTRNAAAVPGELGDFRVHPEVNVRMPQGLAIDSENDVGSAGFGVVETGHVPVREVERKPVESHAEFRYPIVDELARVVCIKAHPAPVAVR